MLGFAALFSTLLPPLHHWSTELFTAHMIIHSILMAVAAPLIVLGRPGAPLLWGLPWAVRRFSARFISSMAASSVWRIGSRPFTAAILHGTAIWLWHLPVLFIGALQSETLHWLQHVSFLATALLFWWVILDRQRSNAGTAMGYLFVTALHTGLLGALMTFSTRVWYPPAEGVLAWGLTPMEDQQLAGLVMWIPVGVIYTLAALLLAAKWLSASAVRQRELGHA
jgi:cytochrome c oxidase assembly factor CtaG